MKKLTYGMIGGSLDAFIGRSHRVALGFDGLAELTAGCFSSNPQKSAETAAFYNLDSARVYADHEQMASLEAARPDPIDFVVIVTPNNVHYAAVKAFLSNGIAVFCEKPLCFEVAEARELRAIAQEKNIPFGVGYSYAGNVMVKEARNLVRTGVIGDIVNVNAEFLQEWLIDDIGAGDQTMSKLSVWRKNPEVAGISNCTGDIGTHIEHTVHYITGLRVKRLAAVLDYFDQPLDLNANILVEFDNGAHGVFCASQVCVGHMNGLVVRIFGTKGAIEWVQENPNILYVTPKGQPTQIYNRGMSYVSEPAAAFSRIPSGHPEGLHDAFANVYKSFTNTLIKRKQGLTPDELDLDFPNGDDGVAGVAFIHAVVKSAAQGATWVDVEE